VAASRKVLEAQAAREPKAAKWAYALAHVASIEAEQATGKAAEKKREEAQERFQHAAEMQPGTPMASSGSPAPVSSGSTT
jgi:hypothetical protein